MFVLKLFLRCSVIIEFIVQDSVMTKVYNAMQLVLDKKSEFFPNVEDIDFDAPDDGDDMRGPELFRQLEDASFELTVAVNIVNVRDATIAEKRTAKALKVSLDAAQIQIAPELHMMVCTRAFQEAADDPETYKAILKLDDVSNELGLGSLMKSGIVDESEVVASHVDHAIKFVRTQAQVRSCSRQELTIAVNHMRDINLSGAADVEIKAIDALLKQMEIASRGEEFDQTAVDSAKAIVTKPGAKMSKPFMICPVLTDLLVEVATVTESLAKDDVSTKRVGAMAVEIKDADPGNIAPDKKVEMTAVAIRDITANGTTAFLTRQDGCIQVIKRWLADQRQLRLDAGDSRFTLAFGSVFSQLKELPKDIPLELAEQIIVKLRAVFDMAIHAILPDIDCVGTKEEIDAFNKVVIWVLMGALIQLRVCWFVILKTNHNQAVDIFCSIRAASHMDLMSPSRCLSRIINSRLTYAFQ